jgi:hypothetical protein
LIDESECDTNDFNEYFTNEFSKNDDKKLLIENIDCLGEVKFNDVFLGRM